MYIEDDKLVLVTKPKTVHFNLTKDAWDLKCEIDSTMKHNEVSAEHAIKKRLDDYCSNLSMETIMMDTKKKQKRVDLTNLFPWIVTKIRLKISKKHVAVQNLSTGCTWKKIRQ